MVNHGEYESKIDLPTLDVKSISQSAEATARTLADAFFWQDRAERLLLNGEVAEAMAVRTDAQDAMGKVFVEEFPHVDVDRATRAGREFMTALFMQDEVENEAVIRDLPDLPTDRLALESPDSRPATVFDDPRWADVRDRLFEVCELAGIDRRYAERQVEFWRYHGNDDHDGYEQAALEAQVVKLRAMIRESHPETFRRLGEYFVAGVRLHDRWDKNARDENFDRLTAVIERYYARVFALQRGERS